MTTQEALEIVISEMVLRAVEGDFRNPDADISWRAKSAISVLRAAISDYEAARPLLEAAMNIEPVDYDSADLGIVTNEGEKLWVAALAYRAAQEAKGKEKP